MRLFREGRDVSYETLQELERIWREGLRHVVALNERLVEELAESRKAHDAWVREVTSAMLELKRDGYDKPAPTGWPAFDSIQDAIQTLKEQQVDKPAPKPQTDDELPDHILTAIEERSQPNTIVRRNLIDYAWRRGRELRRARVDEKKVWETVEKEILEGEEIE